MSRVDDAAAAPATDGPAATDEPRTTTTQNTTRENAQDPALAAPSYTGPTALERALEALGLDESDLDDDDENALEGDAAAKIAGVDPRKLRQLRLLKEHHAGLKSQTEDLGTALKDLERDIVRAYGDAGLTSITLDGYTASLSCRTWVGPADDTDSARMCEVLVAQGGDWAALAPPKYHAQQLSSHVNALDDQGEALPDEVEAVIKRTDKWGVSFRKAARGRAARGKRVPTTAD